MYYPDYFAVLVFILGGVFAMVAYFIRIRQIRKTLNITYIELYDEKYSANIKSGLKGLTRIQITIMLTSIILAIFLSIINKH